MSVLPTKTNSIDLRKDNITKVVYLNKILAKLVVNKT